jgi:hypothetical protein
MPRLCVSPVAAWLYLDCGHPTTTTGYAGEGSPPIWPYAFAPQLNVTSDGDPVPSSSAAAPDGTATVVMTNAAITTVLLLSASLMLMTSFHRYRGNAHLGVRETM